MNTITLLSDLGPQSPVVMMAKGRLSSLDPAPAVVDLSHLIDPGDIREAAFVMKEVIPAFAPNTLHLLAFGKSTDIKIARYKGQYFMSPSEELLSLIISEESEVRVRSLDDFGWHALSGVLADASAQWWEMGMSFDLWGDLLDELQTKNMPNAVINAEELKGTVLHIDGAGNAYTNIHRDDVRRFAKERRIRINLSRHEWVDQISETMNEGRLGDITCSYTEGGNLCVVINNGDARQLLGLRKGSIISIEYI